jgi:hypothetical protein
MSASTARCLPTRLDEKYELEFATAPIRLAADIVLVSGCHNSPNSAVRRYGPSTQCRLLQRLQLTSQLNPFVWSDCFLRLKTTYERGNDVTAVGISTPSRYGGYFADT